MTQEAGGVPQRRCKREGCGHPRHGHRIQEGDGSCFVIDVTQNPRTEIACECPGYLG